MENLQYSVKEISIIVFISMALGFLMGIYMF